MKKILIIGPAPQNIGGISIHIRRLINLLNQEFCFNIVDEGHCRYEGLFNLRSLNLIKYVQLIAKADVIHIHSGTDVLRSFHIIVCKLFFRKKVVVTVHRDPSIEKREGITKYLLAMCDHVIMVNKEGYDFVYKKSNCCYHLMPAFLPPMLDGEPQLPKPISEWIQEKKSSNSCIMVSNAWNLVIHDGEDLYGLDQCIESMKLLKEQSNGVDYALIFVVASNTEQQERMELYKKRIADYDLVDKIMIWEEPMSFVRLAIASDIVLRTTNTDGDAISVREALYFNKVVIASDVVARPSGTILYKTRNVEDLTEQIIKVSNNNDNNIYSFESIDYKAFYSEIYN